MPVGPSRSQASSPKAQETAPSPQPRPPRTPAPGIVRLSRRTVVPDPTEGSSTLNESFRSGSNTAADAGLPASAAKAGIGTEREEVIMARAAGRTSSRSGEGRNRTGDTTGFSPVLYRLSY